MNTIFIGIVNNTLFIAPFYAGDHIHEATITECTKSDFIAQGIVEFDNKKELESSYWSYLK